LLTNADATDNADKNTNATLIVTGVCQAVLEAKDPECKQCWKEDDSP
jgi:hypothetical protein